MSFSFSFNAVDMFTYGMVIKKRRHPFIQRNDSIQLLNRAYGLTSLRPAGQITLDVTINTPSGSSPQDNLDSIKGVLNLRSEAKLEVDWYTDRYWMAKFNSIDVGLTSPDLLEGTIVFDVFAVAAYSNSETISPFIIVGDPENITETIGGTERTRPLFSLICNANLPATTVEIENTATGEIVEWTGDLVSPNLLEIDSETMIIKLNGVESMTTVEGRFPVLIPGNNAIIVRGFSGDMDIIYRERYS